MIAQPLQECLDVLSVACQKPLWTLVCCGDGVLWRPEMDGSPCAYWLLREDRLFQCKLAVSQSPYQHLLGSVPLPWQLKLWSMLNNMPLCSLMGTSIRLCMAMYTCLIFIGHVVDGNEVDRVVFVDFDWAGLQGITR